MSDRDKGSIMEFVGYQTQIQAFDGRWYAETDWGPDFEGAAAFVNKQRKKCPSHKFRVVEVWHRVAGA